MRLAHGDAGLVATGLADMVEMLGVFLRRLASMLPDDSARLPAAAARGSGPRFSLGIVSIVCFAGSRVIGAILRFLDITQMQRTGGGIVILGTLRHHFQRVEDGIIGTFLVLFGLLPFTQLLGQIGGDL